MKWLKNWFTITAYLLPYDFVWFVLRILSWSTELPIHAVNNSNYQWVWWCIRHVYLGSTPILYSYFGRLCRVCFWNVSLQWPISNQEYIDYNRHGTNYLKLCMDPVYVPWYIHTLCVRRSKHSQLWSKKSEHRLWMAELLNHSHLIDDKDLSSTPILYSYFVRPRRVCLCDVFLQWPVSKEEYIDQRDLYKTWHNSFEILHWH